MELSRDVIIELLQMLDMQCPNGRSKLILNLEKKICINYKNTQTKIGLLKVYYSHVPNSDPYCTLTIERSINAQLPTWQQVPSWQDHQADLENSYAEASLSQLNKPW